jgi:hypothetical protein
MAAFLFTTPAARAVTLDFSVHGVGTWQPGSDFNNDAQVTLASNWLIDWYNGGTDPNTFGSTVFELAPTSLTPPPLPSPVSFGFKDETAPFDSVSGTDYAYVLGKYGNISYLFYIGNLGAGPHTLPTTLGGHNLSHLVAFTVTGGGPGVPDGGTTMSLLGMGILLLEGLRRRLKLA